MPETPGAAPAAPVAPAPAAPAPAPAAPPAAAAPQAPAQAPAPAPVVPAAAAAPAAPGKFDPATSPVPPSSSDFPDTEAGLSAFVEADYLWSQAHPDQAALNERDRQAAAEAKTLPDDQGKLPHAARTEEEQQIAEATGEQLAEPAAPADAATPVAAATPAQIEAWQAKSPAFKAALEADPALRDELMATARAAEAAKPILDVVSSVEEAQFAVDNANRMVSLQTNWMLAGDDPEQVGQAWDYTVDLFQYRDEKGEVVKDANGKPVLGKDFKPFLTKASSYQLTQLNDELAPQIQALEQKVAGNYANEEQRRADNLKLEDLKYEKAAYDFVLAKIGELGGSGEAKLPDLPPNATPEQIAFQERLKAQQEEFDKAKGTNTAAARRAASQQFGNEMATEYRRGVGQVLDQFVAGMKERGEYLPEFVLTDKWIDPGTGKAAGVSNFAATIFQKFDAKIANNPLHMAKLRQLEALGPAGKDARIAEYARLRGIYLEPIIKAEVERIQNGIRGAQKPGGAQPKSGEGVARIEPKSGGSVMPAAMDDTAIRTWAEGEAAKDPNWQNLDRAGREALIAELDARKRFGG